MLTCKPRVDQWFLNINGSCFGMHCFSWCSIMIVHFNLNLVIWTLYCNSSILGLKVLLLICLFNSCWSVILIWILLLSLFFNFLLVFIFFTLLFIRLLNRMLFSLFINFLLLLLFHYLMLSLSSFNSFSLFSFIPFLLINQWLTNLLCKVEINWIIFHKSCDCFSAIIDLWKLDK